MPLSSSLSLSMSACVTAEASCTMESGVSSVIVSARTTARASAMRAIFLCFIVRPPYTRRNLRIAVRLPPTPMRIPAAAKIAATGCQIAVKSTIVKSCSRSDMARLLATDS